MMAREEGSSSGRPLVRATGGALLFGDDVHRNEVALSIRQPWVELILSGRKTIEVRTWRTKHRGRLWLHAGRRIETSACALYGVRTSDFVLGAIVGSVEVFDCIEFNGETWSALQPAHLNTVPFDRSYFGWVLRGPKRVQPVACKGALGLMKIAAEMFGPRGPHVF